jgi:hypothetical protein
MGRALQEISMRVLKFTALAAFMAAGAVSASAQTQPQAQPAEAAAPKSCKGLAEADCQAPTCKWVAAGKTKSGKDRKAYCRSASKAKKTPAAADAPKQ